MHINSGQPQVKVCIVGGGISGLMAAYYAQQAGLDWQLFEQAPTLGGLIATRQQQGFITESGPHSFPASAKHMLALCQQLGLTPQAIKGTAKNRYIVLSNQLIALPTNPIEAITSPLLSLRAKCRLLAEPFIKPVNPSPTDDIAVATYIRQRLGPQVADNLVAPLLTGIYAGDPDQLSLQGVFPLLAQWQTTHGSVMKGAFAALKQQKKPLPSANTHDSPPYKRGQILSFDMGMQTLINALIQALPPERLHTHTTVSQLFNSANCNTPTKPRWQITVSPAGNTPATAAQQAESPTTLWQAEHVIVATNAIVASRLLATASPVAADLLAGIAYAPIHVLHIGVERSAVGHNLAGFGFLCAPKANLPLLGCIFASSLFACRAPAGQVLLTVLVGGALQPALASQSEDTLMATIWPVLQQLLSIRPGTQPVLTQSIFWPLAIPQYRVGHVQQWQAIQAALPVGVNLLGNYGPGVALDHLARQANMCLPSTH
jgi:protoporphyrinogen/coproporphyrinogen III oxidase